MTPSSVDLISHYKCLTFDSIIHAKFRDQPFSWADPTPAGSALCLRSVFIKTVTWMKKIT